MADTRGVFGLRILYKKKTLDQWVPLPEVWISPSPSEFGPNTGYFGGGIVSSPTTIRSTIDKIFYASDTRAPVPGATLSSARYNLAATGNSTAGYFGGSQPGSRSTVDKITYSDDTRTTLPSTGSLSVGRSQLAATGNSRSGYFGGGGFSQRSTMDKIIYSTDSTFQVPGASLSTPRNQFAASSARANAIPFSNPAPASPATRFIDGAGPSPGAQPPAATPTPQTYNGSPVNV